MPARRSGRAQGWSKATAAEKVRKAAAVVTKMMRAMRPLSAPRRSASSETLPPLARGDRHQQDQHRVQQQLEERHGQHVTPEQGALCPLVGQHLRARQHSPDREQRHRRGGIRQQPHGFTDWRQQGQPLPGEQRTQQDRPGHGVLEHPGQRFATGHRSAMLPCCIELGQGHTQGGGDDHVHHNGHDGRPGRGWPQKSDQQWNAHEPGVRKRGDQRPKRSVFPADAAIEADGDRERHHDHGAQQIRQRHPKVQ